MNRCLNDLLGYCSGHPHPHTREATKTYFDYRGHEQHEIIKIECCTKDHHTCGHYLAHTQLHALVTGTKTPQHPN